MNRIFAIIQTDKLIFSYETKDIKKENIIKKLIYDKQYLKNNIELTSATINEIIKGKNINQVIINDFDLIYIVLDIIKEIKKIEKLVIVKNKILNYDICEKIISIDHIKYLECYHIAESLLDDFKDKNIDLFLRCEYFINNLFSINNIETYNDIYTKELIVFKNEINDNDLKYFKKICEINEYLNTINILGKFKTNDLKVITNSLIENNLNNVLINIYPENINLERSGSTFSDLRKLGKKIKKEHGITINTKFSDEYKTKNYIKQLNFYNFKTAIILIIMIVSFELLFIAQNMYQTTQDINDVQSLNPENVVIVEENIVIEDEEPTVVEPEVIPEPETNTNQNINTTPTLTQDFTKLLEINSDTVGWLTVNNTKIDYPVVQSENNKYYLNKSFYKKNSIAGWIYMDYRNNIDNLDQNTIIYGHSGMKNSIMFSSLNKIMKDAWLKNTSNHIITFNTLNANMKWQIFSVYVVEPTFDYLRNNYYDDGTRFTNFLNDVKSRSIYNFNVDVTNQDNILTLSTCYEQGTKRLVVHAKLLK
ncbi:MAG: class B sortase [Bacilli bacterium]|nr:class B sortase [Bacilli bacterium]